MHIPRTSLCSTMALCLFGIQLLAHAQSADTIVYNNCLRNELKRLETVARDCALPSGDSLVNKQNPQLCEEMTRESITANAIASCEKVRSGSSMAATEEEIPDPARPTDLVRCEGARCTTSQSKIPVPRPRPANEAKKASPTTDESAATPSGQVGSDSSEQDATAQANADIQSCEYSYGPAQRCCANPASCGGAMSASDQQSYLKLAAQVSAGLSGGDSAGMTSFCQQMNQLGGQGSDVNAALAGVCSEKQSGCTNTCGQLANKYFNLLQSCNGCANQSVYQNAYNVIGGRNSSCVALNSRVQQIASQGGGTATAAGASDACRQMASAAPQSAPSSTTKTASADPYGCLSDPNSLACQSQTPVAKAQDYGTAAFIRSKPKDQGGFDIPGPIASNELNLFSTERNEFHPIKNGTVANNSGGSIPGAGGDGSFAKLGDTSSKVRGQNSLGGAGYTTDILQGSQAGGYSAPVVANSKDDDGMFSWLRGKSGKNKPDEGPRDLDLSQFLPGGSRDPHRRIAGIGGRSEINAKEEDIWRRISNKMEEKCKLGLLMDCR